MPINTIGLAAQGPKTPLALWRFQHPDPTPDQIHIEVKYCGICHSDIHQARGEWGESIYPMVPGHEVAGIVKTVGSNVKNFKPGDRAAVGCFCDSCRKCEACERDLENYCSKGPVWTYNGRFYDGKPTFGGYARDIVVEERFAFKVPENLNLAAASPLLCAGITTYSPMKEWGADKPGTKIGVIGMGGLGHMAVKFGVAFGNEVTVISRSPSKEKEAKAGMGATHFIISTDPKQMEKAKGTLDIIIDTVSSPKDMTAYFDLLKLDGTLVVVGLPPAGTGKPLDVFPLVMKRLRYVGSLVGGMKETAEMLEFCGKHNITSTIEMVTIDKVNEAYERMLKSDVKYRFVIDIEGSCPRV